MAGSSEVGVGVQARGMLLRRALASALEESEWRQDVLRERVPGAELAGSGEASS